MSTIPTRKTSLQIALRSIFGAIWIIDGIIKFAFAAPSSLADMIFQASQGQPSWLAPWFSFWYNAITVNPAAIYYITSTIEVLLGICLVIGLLQKIDYIGGIALGFILWSVPEGFGGPYGPGSTDIGTGIIYMVIYFALIVIDISQGPNPSTLDAIISRKLKWWHKLAEVGDRK